MVGKAIEAIKSDDLFDHAVVQGGCGSAGPTDVEALQEADIRVKRVLREAGDARTATPLIGLCATFDAATHGETVGLVGYGGGCTSVAVEIKELPKVRGLESVAATEIDKPLLYVEYLDRTGVLSEYSL